MPEGNRQQSDQPHAVTHYKHACVVLLAGLSIGFLGVHLFVTRPLQARSDELQTTVTVLENRIGELVSAKDGVAETNTLLESLRSQQRQLNDTREALKTVAQIRTEIEAEATGTVEALASLECMASLQSKLIEGQDQHPLAVEAAEQMIGLRDTLLEEHKSTPRAARALDEMIDLQGRLRSQADDLDEARDSIQAFVALKETVINESGHIVDAIETLEILSDFQQEFDRQMSTLAGMRRSLMEVALMETTVDRVVRVLDPLIQLGQLRRMSEFEIRNAARTILEQRATRLSQNPESAKRDSLGDTAVPSGESVSGAPPEETMFEGLVPAPRDED